MYRLIEAGRNGVRRRVHEYEIEVEKKKEKVYHRCVEETKGKTQVVGSSCFARNSPVVTRTETEAA